MPNCEYLEEGKVIPLPCVQDSMSDWKPTHKKVFYDKLHTLEGYYGQLFTRKRNARGRKVWYYARTAKGRQMRLAVWVGHCADCGEPFEVRVSPYRQVSSAWNLTRCEKHRLTLAECSARAALLRNTKRAAERAEVEELLREGHSVKAVVLATGCPIATVYRWKAKLQTVG
jgi:DNA-binding PadR family transcriptional regulator